MPCGSILGDVLNAKEFHQHNLSSKRHDQGAVSFGIVLIMRTRMAERLWTIGYILNVMRDAWCVRDGGKRVRAWESCKTVRACGMGGRQERENVRA
jgi:hypothetical protein